MSRHGRATQGSAIREALRIRSTSDSDNEVFVALAVMLVGTHCVEPTAAAIVSTVHRIASDNASILRAPRSDGAHN